MNFFQPSFKLDTKVRIGSQIKKQYHPPATPCQRLLASEAISEAAKVALRSTARGLDPIRLLEEIRVFPASMRDRLA